MRPTTYLPILLLAVVLTIHACASDDPPSQPQPPAAPVVTSVSATTVRPGDVVTVAGENFSSVPEQNRIVFNNELAKAIPSSASVDTLVVTVPDFANSGGLYVVTSGQRSGTIAVEVQRNPGEMWVVGGEQDYEFQLPAPAGTEQYVLIPYSAAAGEAADYAYTVTPGTASAFPQPAARRAAMRTPPGRFDEREWRRALAGRGFVRHPVRTGPQTPRDFLIINCSGEGCLTNVPANYDTVTADLVATGGNVFVYADVDQPTGSFTQGDYDAFATLFDTQIFPIDTTAFAPATDIDQNGNVIVLFTRKVNELNPPGGVTGDGVITGFFHPTDLAPGLFPGASNGAEILYLLVPDPGGETGNVFEKSRVDSVVPAVASHELEHVLSYGYRFITLGNSSDPGLVQDRWLEEGMAHVAENLNGIDYANIRRVNRWVVDPGAVSLMGQDVIEQRGAIFMFLRYIGDRFGESIYPDIVQTVCRGGLCVELATGEDFYRLVEDFLATMYLSQRGITADARFNFSSFDLQNDFAPLSVNARAIADGEFSGQVQTATGDYYVLTGLQAPAATIHVAGESAAAQIRTIIIRIQ